MSDFTTDPFTQVYDKLWAILEANTGFTALVKKGNRIKLSGDKEDPIKKQISDADTPEVLLTVTGGELYQRRTSTLSLHTKQYSFVVTTGTLRVNKKLFPIEWAIMRAFDSSLDKNLGLTFVTGFRPGNSRWIIDDDPQMRGRLGWIARIDFDVTFSILNADLQYKT